jgi:hypothetical protein
VNIRDREKGEREGGTKKDRGLGEKERKFARKLHNASSS